MFSQCVAWLLRRLTGACSVMRFRLLLAVLLTGGAYNMAMAAAAFQAAGTAQSGTGAVSPAWPAHAVNDIALLFVESAGGEPATLSTAAGFVAVANSPQSTGAGTAGTRITVFWARATSTSMATPTVADLGNHVYAQIITYRGVVNTGDPWDVTGGGVKAVASTAVTVTSVATTVVDTLIVQAVARDDDSNLAEFSAQANAALTGIAVRSDAGTTSGNGGGFAVWDGVKATAGATGNTTATVLNSINAFLTIALKPSPPVVSSINRASTNPTAPATTVSWTVTFSKSVSGVDAADFSLVLGGGAAGAAITSVTGAGTSWTVTANTGASGGTLGLNLVDNDTIIDVGGTRLGGVGAGNGNFTGQVYTIFSCTPPSNTPVGVTLTCVCDTFNRATLNPSTIFSANWSVSSSDGLGIPPYINGTTGLLRLTENTGSNAKAATVPSIFPAAGNYISVEFNHYAYNGTGADGIAVTLSDSSIPAVPGAFGGSLGYAQRTGVVGFAGGWVGIALDEFGNYQNPTEGRVLGSGFITQSVGVRGPGTGANGYRWMGGTGSNSGGLSIDDRTSITPSPGYMYQVIVDARNYATSTVNVMVNRDATTKDGSNYNSLFGPFNAYTEANYALGQGWIAQLVPDYWKISFTGSTGGSTNIHEIGSLRVCAQTIYPPTGGTASGFSAIDEAYPIAPPTAIPAYPNFQTGDIFMKLTGVPFRLWVAALTGTGISTGYSVTNKFVQVKLVDNSDNVCGLDTARTCNAGCTGKVAVEGGATQIVGYVSSDKGAKLSPSFTLNTAWKNLIAIMKECTDATCASFTATAPACSADSFSVRPTGITSVTSSNATNVGTAGTPIFKAGSDNFSLTATTSGIVGSPSGYTGQLKINNAALLAVAPASFAGTATGSFPAATSGTPSSTATGNNFTYSEVGGFLLPGYLPSVTGVPGNDTSPRAVFDGVATASECTSPGLTTAQCDLLRAATWTGLDSVSTKGDCVLDNYANVKNASGKYGCNFGLMTNTATIGRFVPDHFALTTITVNNRSDIACVPPSPFTYMDEPMSLQFTLTAQNAANGTTKNYTGAFAKLPLSTPTATLSSYGLGAQDSYPVSSAVSITQITKANPGVVTTAAAHGYITGDKVYISDVQGMVEANNQLYIVAVTDATHFSIVNTSGYTAYVAAGTVRKKAPSGTDLSGRISLLSSSGTWPSDGINNGVASDILLNFIVTRLAAPDGPYVAEFGLAPVDSDGVKLSAYDMDIVLPAGNDHTSVAVSAMRFGRLKLNNALGSEQLPLPLGFAFQYWNPASGGFITNSQDSCTSFGPANIGLGNFNKDLQATETSVSAVTLGTGANTGTGTITFAKPSGGDGKYFGSFDLVVNLGATTTPQPCGALTPAPTPAGKNFSYLRGAWGSCGATYTRDPTARAAFGVYKSPNEFIYIRENY